MNTRHRAWVYTRYFDKHGETQFPLEKSVAYLVEGYEICPTTGREHGQGYIRFRDGVTLNVVQSVLGDTTASLHVEPRKGSEQQCIRYCLKEGGRHLEYGVRGRQGNRSDLRVALEWIKFRVARGQYWDEIELSIADEFPVLFTMYERKFRKYAATMRRRSRSRALDRGAIDVTVYIGPPGTGKTRRAVAENPEAFIHNGGKWFDGYDGHDVIIFDDFDPERIPIFTFMKYLDRYRNRFEVKGDFVENFASHYIITTNIEVDNWYPCAHPTTVRALKRRIVRTVRFQ